MGKDVFFGRTAIVTGAGSGIGRELALRLSRAGSRVVITDVAGDRVEKVAGEIRAGGGDASGFCVDHSKLGEVEDFAAKFREREGHVDILCLNAGVAWAAGSRSLASRTGSGCSASTSGARCTWCRPLFPP